VDVLDLVLTAGMEHEGSERPRDISTDTTSATMLFLAQEPRRLAEVKIAASRARCSYSAPCGNSAFV